MARTEDVLDIIRATQTFKEWKKRYSPQLTGIGVTPYQVANGIIAPIPPDTYGFLMNELLTVEAVAFATILRELEKERVDGNLAHTSLLGRVAEMQFYFRPVQK